MCYLMKTPDAKNDTIGVTYFKPVAGTFYSTFVYLRRNQQLLQLGSEVSNVKGSVVLHMMAVRLLFLKNGTQKHLIAAFQSRNDTSTST